MQRVMIIGQPGSGKSTLARLLGERMGLPVLHMDRDVHWLPGWCERDRGDKLRILAEWHAKPRWIIEGGVSSTWCERARRADTVVFLDVGYLRRTARLVRRAIRLKGQSRPDMANGCTEQMGTEFRDFMIYCWQTRKGGRAKCARIMEEYEGSAKSITLRTFRDVENFVAQACAT